MKKPPRDKLGLVLFDDLKKMIREDGDCWVWTGPRNKEGHPLYTFRAPGTDEHMPLTATVSPSRAIYRMYNGEIRSEQYVYCGCGNRLCVSPYHRTLNRAKRAEVVFAKGEKNNKAKLTENDVRAILARARAGERHVKIAKDYPVSESTIWMIIKRKTWRHVKLEGEKQDWRIELDRVLADLGVSEAA